MEFRQKQTSPEMQIAQRCQESFYEEMIKTSTSNFRTIQKQEVDSAYSLLNRDQRKEIVSKYIQVKQSKGIKKEKLK